MVKNLLLSAVLCNALMLLVESYSRQDVIEDLQSEYKRSFDSIFNSNHVEGPGGPNSLLSFGVPRNFKCKRLREPKNGEIRCGGTLCLVQCNEGYIQHRKHAFVYQCKGGRWLTIPKGKPVPWPDCVKMPPFAKY